MIKKILLLVYFIILIEVILKFIGYYSNEWLIIKGFYINYEAGFIRRGLFGSILFFLANNTPIEPFKFQLIFEIILLILLVFFIIKEFYLNKLEPYILFGSFMLINVIAYKMFFTLDVLLIVYFLFQLYVINKIKSFNLKIVICNLMSIFMILIHEAYFVFTFFPILYCLNITNLNSVSIKKISLLIPSFFVFLLVGICFNGSNRDINIIINSWNKFGTDHLNSIKELYWVFNSTDEVIMWKIPIFKKHPIYLLGFFFNTCLIFLSMFIYLKKNFRLKSNNIFLFLTCQYIAILLICLIAVDYVRWFWLSNIITLFTLVQVNSSNSFFKSINISIPAKVCALNKYIILFIGLPLGGSWSPTQFIHTMPIKHLFDFGNRILLYFS